MGTLQIFSRTKISCGFLVRFRLLPRLVTMWFLILGALVTSCESPPDPAVQDYEAPTLKSVATTTFTPASLDQIQPTEIMRETSTPPPNLETPKILPRLGRSDPLLFDELYMINADVGWAVTADVHAGNLFRSSHLLRTEDGGSTWLEVTPPELVRPSDTDSIRVYGFFMDEDLAWVILHSTDDIKATYVWHTKDGGLTWESGTLRTRGATVLAAPWIEFTDPNHGWLLWDYFTGAGSHEGDILRSDDGGLTWESVLLEDYLISVIHDTDFSDSRSGRVVSGHGPGFVPPYYIKSTRDGGLTWNLIFLDDEEIPKYLPRDCYMNTPQFMKSSTLRVHVPCLVYEGETQTMRHYLGTTKDSGQTWDYVELPGKPYALGDTYGWAMPDLYWSDEPAGEPSMIYRTTDGGNHWREIAQVPWIGELFFATGQDGWAIVDGELLATVDGGATWTAVDPKLIDSNTYPLDDTDWLRIERPINQISTDNLSQVSLIGELSAPSPVSMAIGSRNLYVGLKNGRMAVWSGGVYIPRVLPQLRLGESWIYDIETYSDYPGFIAVSKDGNIYYYYDFHFDSLVVEPTYHGEASGLAFHPGGIITSGEDGVIRAHPSIISYDPDVNLEYELKGHNGWVWDVDLSSDTQTLASAGADKTIRLWDAVEGRDLHVLQSHVSAVTKVRFSPDDRRLASASRDGTVRIWDVDRGEELDIYEGHQDWVLDLAYSNDGSLIASVDAMGDLILWDTNSGIILRRWSAHTGPARAVVFSPDGTMLITAGDDNAVRLWGIEP